MTRICRALVTGAILDLVPFTSIISFGRAGMMSTKWNIVQGRLTDQPELLKSLVVQTILHSQSLRCSITLSTFVWFATMLKAIIMTRDLKSDFSGEGAWNQGNDIDPKLEKNDDYPTHGKVCDTMKYFGFNPTKINKFAHLSRLPHPASGSHYFFEWLGFPGGYRAIVESDRQLDGDIVALSATDRARQDLHIPYSPDDGVTFITRTMEIGQTSTAYDQHVLEDLLLSTSIHHRAETIHWWFSILLRSSTFTLFSWLLER